MISASARLISPAAPAWPMASPSPKLCRPIPTAIRSASWRPVERRSIHGREANSSIAAAPGPTSVEAAPLLHPPVVVDEAHETRDEAAGEERGVADELGPRAFALDGSRERLLDGLDAVHEHVPEEEEENAAGKRRETGSQPDVGALDAPEGQAQEDRESRHRTQCERLCRRHAVGRPFVVDVRVTLQAGGA